MVSGGEELNEKLQRMVRKFAENIDPEDPEYITLREAFHARFHEHGFTPQIWMSSTPTLKLWMKYSKSWQSYRKECSLVETIQRRCKIRSCS